MFNANTNFFEIFDFQKILTAAKMPSLDVNSEALINSQKKTMEAFAGASKATFEGVNAFSKKQVEILNAAISSAKDATSEIAKGHFVYEFVIPPCISIASIYIFFGSKMIMPEYGHFLLKGGSESSLCPIVF